jgi:transcriptional regulator with XRE-family HTH domain
VSKRVQGLSKALATVVAKRRQAMNLSRQELATRAGVHQTYIGLLERGLRKPTLEVADAVAQALGAKLSDLILDSEALRRK